MSVSTLHAPDFAVSQETHGRIVHLYISLSQQLVADAISMSFGNRFEHLRISRGELHLKSKPELEQVIDMVHNGVFIVDTDTLRQIEAKLDCSVMLQSTILLTSPNELLLNGTSRKEVMGMVSWDNSFLALRQAIEMVISGRRYVDRLLESTLREITTNGTTVLTNRQMQILRMVAAGDSSRQIATKLKLSRRTVENHRARILERLGVSSAAEMIQAARQNKWI